VSGWFYKPYIGKLFKDISYVAEFEKDLKKLARRFASLEGDLQVFINVAMNMFHKQNIESRAILQMSDVGIRSPKIYKSKKFACKALKGKGVQSEIRVIYAYHGDEDRVEFVEIYYKGDKENEDRFPLGDVRHLEI
jgi:hypothetical protein